MRCCQWEDCVGVPFTIQEIAQRVVDGAPVLVLVCRAEEGEQFGIYLTEELATSLTEALGEHPVVTEFFKRRH
jgi:hypothetical protein